MENLYARRNFLKNVALAASGVAVLSPTSVLQAFNKGDCPYEGYNPFAEEKADMRLSKFSGNHVTIEGKILSKSNLSAASGATLEVWHLSPDSSKYRHQAKIKLDENGAYRFITDFPNKEAGKYPKMFFKISEGNKVVFTELSLTTTDAYINDKHYAENKALKEDMFPTTAYVNNQHVVTFNTLI